MGSSGRIEYGIDTNGHSRSGKIKTTRLVGSIESSKDLHSRLKRLESAHARKRYVKAVSMLIVVCAAATVVVSALALTEASQATQSRKAPPGTPHPVFGYTYDIDGVSPLVSCDVVITDLTTMEQIVTTSDPVEGIYSVDLSALTLGWLFGDILNVTAQKGAFSGWNESAITDTPEGYNQIDVWVKEPVILIPEFPMVIAPVAGIIALFAVMSVSRKGKEQ